MEMLAFSVADVWSWWVWPILLFVIGLGLVVFVHELGHFLVAKAVGIKVERFALGFGPRLVGFKKGDTDYCVNVLPLGGYVKMLGQEDFKPLTEEDKPDPRAFSSKSVGARFAVIAAGVVMNVIMAAVLFIIVSMVGMKFPAPYIGHVTSGFPAAQAQITWQDELPSQPTSQASTQPSGAAAAAIPSTAPSAAAAARKPTVVVLPATLPASAAATGPAATAPPASAPAATTAATSTPASMAAAPAEGDIGLKPGDKVLRIQGNSVTLHLLGDSIASFSDMHLISVLSDRNDKWLFTIQREVDGRTRIGTAEIGVKENDGVLNFGVGPAADTDVELSRDIKVDSPFMNGDTVTAINGRPVRYEWDIEAMAPQMTGRPVTVTVERDGKPLDIQFQPRLESVENVHWLKSGQVVRGAILDVTKEPFNVLAPSGENQEVKKVVLKIQIPGGEVRTVKMEDKSKESLHILGMIPRLRIDGIAKGSLFKSSPAEKAGLQPGDIIIGYGDQGVPTHQRLEEINDRVAGQETKITVLRDGAKVTLSITPRKADTDLPDSHATIGIMVGSDEMHTVVAGVSDGSPAAKAGIESGTVIKSINGQDVASWIDIYNCLKAQAGKPVSIRFQNGPEEKTADLGILTPAMFEPKDYEFAVLSNTPLRVLRVVIQEENPLKALVWGGKETVRQIINSYVSLRSLAKGNVSPKMVTGPVGLGGIAVEFGRRGLVEFMYFMAIISAALAVMNFLPIPVVDGGHAMFLLIEKVRRKPVPVAVQNVAQIIGLVLLVGVLILVTWNDITRMIK